MNEDFHFYSWYNITLRKANTLSSRCFNSVHSSENSLVLSELKTWELAPTKKKRSESLEYKIKVKYCKPTDCSWRLCKSDCSSGVLFIISLVFLNVDINCLSVSSIVIA